MLYKLVNVHLVKQNNTCEGSQIEQPYSTESIGV